MFNGRKTKFFLLVTLLFLCMSVVAAEDTSDITVSDDANQTLTTSDSSILEEAESIEATQDSVVNQKDDLSSDSTYNVNSYGTLVNTIDTIKNSGSTDNYIINLQENTDDEHAYDITETITWGDSQYGAVNLTINGNGVTIDGQDTTQFIEVSSGYTLTLTNMTITDCTAEDGGAIYNEGTLILENVTFLDNTALYGAAIYNTGILSSYNVSFTSNTVTYKGGGIYNTETGKVYVENSTFTSNNQTEMSGGNTNAYGGAGIYTEGELIINNTHFTGNTATSDGGAVYLNDGILNVTNCSFTDNTASIDGGAINVNDNSVANITGSTFIDNDAGAAGGAIIVFSGAYITGSSFIDNSATTHGSAIYIAKSTTVVEENYFSGNSESDGETIYATVSYTIKGNILDDETVFINNEVDLNTSIIDTSYSFYFVITAPNGTSYTVIGNTSENKYTYDVAGIWNVTSYYEDVEDAIASYDVLVELRETSITVSVDDAYVWDTVTISGVLDSETGFVSGATIEIYLNGVLLGTNTTLDDGSYSYTFNATNETTSVLLGYNVVDVVYSGNESYTGIDESANFIVSQLSTIISVEPVEVFAGETATITGTILDNNGNPVSGKLTVTVDGTSSTVDAVDGEFNFDVETSVEDVLNVVVSYAGNDRYVNTHTISSITVNKRTTSLTFDKSYDVVAVTTPITITGTLTDYDSKPVIGATVTISISGVDYDVITGSDGSFSLVYTPTVVEEGVVVSASYAGNDTYEASTGSTVIDVEIIGTSISVSATEYTVINGSLIVTGSLVSTYPSGVLAGATVTVTIKDETGETIAVFEDVIVDENGEFSIEATAPSSIGVYTVIASYAGNSTHQNAIADTSFDVEILSTTLTLDEISDVQIGEDITISGTLTDENGNAVAGLTVTIIVNEDKEIQIETDSEGKFTTTYTTSITGLNTVNADFGGVDDIYMESSDDVEFNVAKNETSITFDEAIYVTTIDQTVTISGVLKDKEGNPISEQTVTITIGDYTEKVTTGSDGSFSLDYTPTGEEITNVIASFDETDVYLNSSDSSVLVVDKIGVNLVVDDLVITNINSTALITGTITDEYGNRLVGAQLSITINDGVEYIVNSTENGAYSITIASPSTAGDYTITVTYAGNASHVANTTTGVLEVDVLDTRIIMDTISTSKYGDEVTISGTLIDENGNIVAGQTVLITVNDEDSIKVTTDANGKFITTYPASLVGLNTITVSYDGQESTYLESSVESEFYVDRLTTTTVIDSEYYETIVGQPVTITGNVTDEKGNLVDNAKITIIVGDYTDTTNTDNGVFIFTYTPTSTANAIIVAYVDMGEYYYSSMATAYLFTEAIPTTITIGESYTSAINKTYTVTGTLTGNDGSVLADATVIVSVNGVNTVVKTDSNGIYSLELTAPSTSGSYDIDVTYEGDSTHTSATTDSSLTVNTLDTSIILDSISSVIVGEEVTITGILADTEGNPVSDTELTVTINDETTPVMTNSTGGFTITYTTTKAGENTVEVSFNGLTNVYEPSSTTGEFNVIDLVDTIITIDTINDVTIGDVITITGVLEDTEGNSLSDMNLIIIINGETSTVTTDSTGGFTTEYTTSVAGTNNITVVFDGKEEYQPTSTITEFNVEKLVTVITTADIVDKYNNTVVFTASVVDANGNPVNTGKVVFKLNGKTLGTADVVDGVATYTYTITNTAKDYTITAKYGETSTYTSSEVNATLTVTNRVADLQITPLAEDIIVQDTVTFTVVVSDESQVVDGGIVIFKVNGVTIKNEDGGSLNATVVNGVATVTYTIPTSFSARDYILTAVYSNKNYDRAEENITFTVIKSDVTAQLDTLTTVEGQNTTVTMTLYDEDGRQVERDTKVAIKINGKTYISTTTTSGVLNVELPTESLNEGTYNITIVFGENSQYNTLRLETILIITSQTTDSENGTLTEE